MIRAGIATCGLLVWDVSVFLDEKLEEVVLRRARVVGDKTEALNAIAALVTNHVLVEHALDLDSKSGVAVEDILRSEKTCLLSRVPVELDSVEVIARGNARILEESSEEVEKHQRSRTVIISSWGSPSTTVVGNNRVKMRSSNNSLEADLSGNGHNDRGLRPSLVLDETDRGERVLALLDNLLDLLVQPFGRFHAICRVEVTVVERRELLEPLLNGLLVDVLDDIVDIGLEDELIGEFACCGGQAGGWCWAVILPFSDVEEVNVVLEDGQHLSSTALLCPGLAYVNHLEFLILGNLDGLSRTKLQRVHLLGALLGNWPIGSSCGGECRHDRK